MREWLQQQFTGARQSPQWTEFWAMAALVDFSLGRATDDRDLWRSLGTDDQVEVGLRHLSAYVCETRTKDKAGAAKMRAVVAPGSGVDVAPCGLVEDATTFSKMES